MICPRTKGNCGCNSAADCMLAPVAVAVGPFNLFTSPPPPTLEEIERLVDELLGKATFTPYAHPHHYRAAKDEEAAARAALMAAIRAYGRE